MTTKTTINVTTGLVEEVEMTGAELAAFEIQRAAVTIVYADAEPIEKRVRTTNATPTEIYRRTLPVGAAFRADLEVFGIAENNVNLRYVRAICVVGRGAGSAAVIPTRVGAASGTIAADHANGTAGAWPLPTLVAIGPDIVISVTGEAGRAIGWLLVGSVVRVAPAGLP